MVKKVSLKPRIMVMIAGLLFQTYSANPDTILSKQNLSDTAGPMSIRNYTQPDFRKHELSIWPEIHADYHSVSEKGTPFRGNNDGLKNTGAFVTPVLAGAYTYSLLNKKYLFILKEQLNINPFSYDHASYTYYQNPFNIEVLGEFSESSLQNTSIDNETYIEFRKYFNHHIFFEFNVMNSYIGNFDWERTYETGNYMDFSQNSALVRYAKSVGEGKSNDDSLIVKLSLGKGRIWDVTNAAVALELSKISGVKKSTRKINNQNTLNEVGRFLEKIKNRRVFNSRKALKKDIVAISAFLKTNRFIDSLTPENIMDIEEVWKYGYGQRRKSGRELTFSPEFKSIAGNMKTITKRVDFSGSIPFVNTLDEFKNEVNKHLTSSDYYYDSLIFNRNTSEYYLDIGYQREYPFLSIWQLSTGADANAGIADMITSYESASGQPTDHRTSKNTKMFPQIEANGAAELSCYLNLRTTLRTRFDARYRRGFDSFNSSIRETHGDTITKSSESIKNDRRELNCSFDGRIYYYFTPQLTLLLGAEINFYDNYLSPGAYNYFEKENGFHWSIYSKIWWDLF
jgi:hypothetical protein